MNITINKKDLIVYEEDEEVILVNLVKNNFHGLDYTGSFIWKVIEGTKEMDNIMKILCKRFNVEESEIKDDIVEFILELEKLGAVKVNGKKS